MYKRQQGEDLKDYLDKIEKSEEEVAFLPVEDNIIPVLDEEWFADDIVERFNSFLKVSFGEKNFRENLNFVEESLGKDIRKYFTRDFYNDHIKRYKKRPIYWMFSSPKGYFSVLIYMHRYTPDTVSRILNAYLREFIDKLERQRKQQEHIEVSGSTVEQNRARKEIDRIDIMPVSYTHLYEKLRKGIINNHFINNLIQLEYSGFDGATVPICTFTLRNSPIDNAKGSYIRLSDFKGSENQAPKTLEAINNPDCGWFYTANQKNFKKIPGSPIGYWSVSYTHLTLNHLLSQSTIYMGGSENKSSTSSDGRTRILESAQDLILLAYPKLKLLGSRTFDEAQLNLIMSDKNTNLFSDDNDALSPPEQEILNFLERRKDYFDKTTLSDIKDNFSRKPYGWSTMAIWCITARLFKRGKIEATLSFNPLDDKGMYNAFNNNREWDKTLITPQIQFDPLDIALLKQVYQKAFNESNPYIEAKAVAIQFKERAGEEEQKRCV